MNRQPAVSNSFYPGNPLKLRKNLAELIPVVPDDEKQEAAAVIVPHAGFVYSGGVAGETYARIKIPETVIILGPNHHGRGHPLALAVSDWDMVLGRVEIERQLADIILDTSTVIRADDSAHIHEHSIEVQVPFLQIFNNNLKILPLLVSRISYGVCVQAGHDLAAAVRSFSKTVLLVASTDMSHYEPRHRAAVKDQLAMERITELDPAGLYKVVMDKQISMCGFIPTIITMLAAMELGAGRAELIKYTDSGELSGDTDQVVGYAGFVLSFQQ